MDLRAPLPPDYNSTIHVDSSSGTIAESESSQFSSFHAKYQAIIGDLLRRMFVSSQVMELGSESRFCGLVLFHRYGRRFYRFLREQRNHRQPNQQEHHLTEDLKKMKVYLGQAAAACLYLGCKIAEEQRRIRDVINLSHVLGFSDWNESLERSSNERDSRVNLLSTIEESVHPPQLNENYWTAKEEIISMEQQVLRMLQFDASVCHPHRCVLIVMDTLGFGITTPHSNPAEYKAFLTPEQSDRIVLDAWRLLNEASVDASGDALIYPVIVISCAAIALAADGIGGKNDHRSSSAATGSQEASGNDPIISLPDFWWRALDVKTNEILPAKYSLTKLIRV